MTTLRPLSVALFVAAACSFGITSCDSSDPAEGSLTKKQFANQADLICSKANNEQYKLVSTYFVEHPSLGAVADLTQTQKTAVARKMLLPTLQKASESLDELPAPPGFEEQADRYRAAYSKALEEVEAKPLLLAAEPGPFMESDRLAKKYELGDCGANP